MLYLIFLLYSLLIFLSNFPKLRLYAIFGLNRIRHVSMWHAVASKDKTHQKGYTQGKKIYPQHFEG